MPDFTRTAVKRQLAAMGCPAYELIIRQWTGPDDYYIRERRGVTASDIFDTLSAIRRANARGCDVWIVPRPGPDQARLVLVDDLDSDGIEALRVDGVIPAVISETSPGNYQVWVRVPRRLQAILAARVLCTRYAGDPGGIGDGDQPGRLTGLTNRKPCHRRNDGRYPFVLLRSAKPDAPALSLVGPLAADFAEAKHDLPSAKERDHTPPEGAGGCPAERPASAGVRDVSPSGKDWAVACRMIAMGDPDEVVLTAILSSAEARGKRQPRRYAERTLRRARQHVRR